MRDRLLLARDLLAPSGSVFVQISDENLHHVRELLDEVFAAETFVVVIWEVKAAAAERWVAAVNADGQLERGGTRWHARCRRSGTVWMP